MKILDGKIIANNIKAERNRAGKTIDEVCSYLGISRTTYVEYEKNAEVIKASILVKLSNCFNCDICMFFYTK